jgi:pimeloyl-ACP methyl ester carboxylesterase
MNAARTSEIEARFSRRALLERGAALAVGASLAGQFVTACGGDGSPSGRQPSVFAPVFYGWQELDASGGAPGKLRVWYPSLEGSPQDAPIVSASFGRFPLVLFLHGNCSEQPDHYSTWFLVPAELARTGYVVVVPDLPNTRTGSPPWTPVSSDLTLAESVVRWMRASWANRERLLPATGVVGHSYGALLGSRIAASAASSPAAYVSIAGVWSSWDTGETPRPLSQLRQPALFMWGDSDLLADMLAPPRAPLFDEVPRPRHRIVFRGGEHWDHWRPTSTSTTPCGRAQGACGLVGALTADFTAVFLSKYMRPESMEPPPATIGDDLRLPRVELTQEQRPYEGGHLPGLSRLGFPQHSGCVATHTWATAGGTGTVSDWPRR